MSVNWIALLCITGIACVAAWVLGQESKDILIAAISGIVGYLSHQPQKPVENGK